MLLVNNDSSCKGIKTTMMLALASTLPSTLVDANNNTAVTDCYPGRREFDPIYHKETYYVGIHAPGGIHTAIAQSHLTFEEYLTATAGQRFDPPIQFKIKPTSTPIYSWVDIEHDVDFFYSDTGVYSCLGVEVGAQPLATTVSDLTVRGHKVQLDQFAGVIVTMADRADIRHLEDLKGKVIGALEIGDFAGAQAQFYSMKRAGMDHIMDPKQVIFVGNELEIVKGVYNRSWEVGFVRTGIIERVRDENGNLLDPDLFKVIDPELYVMEDGTIFPYLHSTPVFPEWPVYSSDNTPRAVVEEVQDALFAMDQHIIVGEKINECYDQMAPDICDNVKPDEWYTDARCDTTTELAKLAYDAHNAGFHYGFRPPRSYFDLRNMQQAAGFLRQDDKGDWRCTRAESLHGAITCPEGHYKLSVKDFDRSCELVDVPCPDGMNCYCKPCVKAYEVDLFEWTGQVDEGQEGCSKMALCASVEQTKTITFRAIDNRERVGAKVSAVMHIGEEAFSMEVNSVPGSGFTYEFEFSYDYLGIGILELYINGAQIPQSPIRMQVEPRDCNADFAGQRLVAAPGGTCVCATDAVQVGSECVSSVVFFVVMSVGIVLCVAAVVVWYLGYQKRRNDRLWLINVDELHFDDPVDVIGSGSFGVVLLAEYRGTKVAIKRALAIGEKKKKCISNSGSKENSSRDRMSGGSIDVEAQSQVKSTSGMSGGSIGASSFNSQGGFTASGADFDGDLGFLGHLSFGQKQSTMQVMCPWFFPERRGGQKAHILGSVSGKTMSSSKSMRDMIFPCFSKENIRKEEFIVEMRLLSRLRHPCITTVMGAVISPAVNPMLVMEYMDYGSLHDLLRNETMHTGGEVILPICRDIAQGLRYLHAFKPPILHGDLKARNILVDSRFRAKVADFGLSTKKKAGLCGTPYFLAPEYLRGKNEYNAACDMYSIGITMFEIYARQEPYAGENPRKVLRKICNPRTNKRPFVPESCPPKMVEIMKKCWSADPFYRPQAKDLDLLFMDMSVQDAEPACGAHHKPKAITTEDMLYEVFPRHIADALKAGNKVEPESHETVTVVFSDIVHFTDISKSLSAMKVSQMLDRLYLSFDEVARKHKIFKVETIGDAYMGVTNLSGNEDDTHVKQIAEFSIDLVEAATHIMIDAEDPSRGGLRVRVGFHTGPVVSNVIGSLNPRYGLFGDTVNTASRMESNSSSQRIHCSEKAAKLLAEQAPDIPIIKRGKIGVKGKGQMTTYWVGTPPTKASKEKALHVDFYGEQEIASNDTDITDIDILAETHTVSSLQKDLEVISHDSAIVAEHNNVHIVSSLQKALLHEETMDASMDISSNKHLEQQPESALPLVD